MNEHVKQFIEIFIDDVIIYKEFNANQEEFANYIISFYEEVYTDFTF